MKERKPPRVPAASPMRSFAPKARDIPSLICPRPKSSSATAPNRLMLTTTDSTRSPRLSCLPPLFPEEPSICPVHIVDCGEKTFGSHRNGLTLWCETEFQMPRTAFGTL